MPLSNSAIRSYTQPSCTLQILEPSTALDGGEQPPEAQQFDLRFGDPQQQQEQISIRGDRQQLTELHESVNNYIQNFLGSSSERFNTLLSPQTNIASETGVLHTLQMQDTVTPEAQEIETYAPAGKIFLQSAGRLTHNLFLGSLANPETGQIIQLPTTQLFDLAAVLDEHAADVLGTPVVNRGSRRAASAPSTAWVSIAAMLLLGVGLTAAVVQLLNRDETPQTANRTNIPTNTNQQIALQPSPTPSLASPDTLPPLPPGTTTSPSPTASLPPGIPTPGAIPGSPLPVPQATPGIPSPPPISTTKTPITSLPGIAQAPSVPSQRRSPQLSEESISIARPTVPETSRVTALPGISPSTDIPAPPPQSRVSDRQGDGAIPGISAAPEQTAHQRLKAALERRSGNTPVELTPEAPQTQNPNRAPQTTAFVNTPQLKEVKEYFQKNWQPPSGLTQTLEYSIVLDVDGTIQRIEPLGKAARTYVDRSGLPLIGEPFVSPNSSGDTPRIRVVLSPDGNVQTFAEPLN